MWYCGVPYQVILDAVEESLQIFSILLKETLKKTLLHLNGLNIDYNVCYIFFNIHCVYFYYHDQYHRHHRHHHINLIVIVSSVIKDTIKYLLILLTGQVGGIWDTS